MSLEQTISHNPKQVPLGWRMVTRMAIGLARLLVRLPPNRLRAVLSVVRRGAAPASYGQALTARRRVVLVSLACAGRESCLPRSVAAALLCRVRGTWPTWCVGIRTMPPFAAHAWIEAEGQPVDEPYPDGYHKTLMSVTSQPGLP